MNTPQTEFDSPWKEIISQYFQYFIQFFLPGAYNEIDWTRQPEFLDTELPRRYWSLVMGHGLWVKDLRVS